MSVYVESVINFGEISTITLQLDIPPGFQGELLARVVPPNLPVSICQIIHVVEGALLDTILFPDGRIKVRMEGAPLNDNSAHKFRCCYFVTYKHQLQLISQ